MLYDENDYLREKPDEEGLDIGRSAFRRDYGRLLHCPAFRRLQGKTQLFPGHESDFFRNRLTHSLEVAQVAKGIALRINKTCAEFQASPIDLDLVEFAGLAHDLGHPPFGHNGERALDDCMKNFGGFEGNAQTLRILSRVEKKTLMDDPSESDVCGISREGVDRRLGLNLTYRTLAAILKYDAPIPLRRKESDALKKGYYASERGLVENIKRHVGSPGGKNQKFKTIECQIMDIADDIAYSTYDLEDTMKADFTHPLALLAKIANKALFDKLWNKVKKEIEDVTEDDVFAALTDIFIFPDLTVDEADAHGTSVTSRLIAGYEASKLIAADGAMRSKFSSAMIDGFVRGVSVTPKVSEGIRFSEIGVSERDQGQDRSIEAPQLSPDDHVSALESSRISRL